MTSPARSGRISPDTSISTFQVLDCIFVLSFPTLVIVSCSRKRAPSPTEIQIDTRNKRNRMRDLLTETRISGWREVDEKKECFVMDALSPTLAFPEIGIRRNAELNDNSPRAMKNVSILLEKWRCSAGQV